MVWWCPATSRIDARERKGKVCGTEGEGLLPVCVVLVTSRLVSSSRLVALREARLTRGNGRGRSAAGVRRLGDDSRLVSSSR